MTDFPPTVRDLKAARDLLRSQRHPGSAAVAMALDAILAGQDACQALGLKAHVGKRSALTVDRLRQRNCIIRQLAACHFASRSISDQARGIAAAGAAYWRRAAKLDRELSGMPASYAGTPRELLFEIARLPADMPKERTIRAILSASPRRE